MDIFFKDFLIWEYACLCDIIAVLVILSVLLQLCVAVFVLIFQYFLDVRMALVE